MYYIIMKKLQWGKTVKCYPPPHTHTHTHTHRSLPVFFDKVDTAVLHLHVNVILRNTCELTVTSDTARNFSASELGLSVKTSDRLTQHHTVYTLHINKRHKIQGALNPTETAHYIKMVHATQKWLKHLALLCHISTCLHQTHTIIKESPSDKPSCKNMRTGKIWQGRTST
jgi:hypothetical protein